MSDDIEVTTGGAIAVDTATLEHTATALDAIELDLLDLAVTAAQARAAVEASSGVSGGAGVDSAASVCRLLEQARTRVEQLAGDVRTAAHAYEIVELTNERALAAAAGDLPREAAAAALLAAARAADPAAATAADLLAIDWRLRWTSETAGVAGSPLSVLAPFGPPGLGLLAPLAIAGAGRGFVPRGARLTGPVPEVAVRPVGAADRVTTAPTGLATALSRIPTGTLGDDDPDGSARVRVERSTMPDGSREYTVYVAGTQDWWPGSDDAFDLESNLALYRGQESESYEAVRAALEASGAESGDPLHLVAYSQGAMAATYVAQDGAYDIRTLITAGSPTSTDLPSDTLSIALEHVDDPVAALQGPRDTGGQGSAESLVVRRTVDDATGLGDLVAPGHRHQAYVDTAQLFERSDDPRAAAVAALFDHLATATEVTVTEYSAVAAQ